MSWLKENWKSIIIQTGLASGTTFATTMAVAAQPIIERCKPGTVATFDIRPESPIAWILLPVFAIGFVVMVCGFVAVAVGIISLYFKDSGKARDIAAALNLQEQFFFDPSYRINRLLIGWGFSSFATVLLLIFVVGVIFGEKC